MESNEEKGKENKEAAQEQLKAILNKTFPDYDFVFTQEYDLYKQNLKVYNFKRVRQFSNIRRQNSGYIVLFNNNPGDVVWNVQDISKMALTDLMKIENRINKAQGKVSQNLFHSSSFKSNEGNTFSSEHEDSLLSYRKGSSRNDNSYMKFKQPAKEHSNNINSDKSKTSESTKTESNKQAHDKLPKKTGEIHEQSEKSYENKQDPRFSKFRKKEGENNKKKENPSKPESTGKRKIITEYTKPKTLDNNSFEDFINTAREKGWLKK